MLGRRWLLDGVFQRPRVRILERHALPEIGILKQVPKPPGCSGKWSSKTKWARHGHAVHVTMFSLGVSPERPSNHPAWMIHDVLRHSAHVQFHRTDGPTFEDVPMNLP